MKDFTDISPDHIIYQGEYFFIIEDIFPVSPGHLLIISNQLKTDFFELSTEEKKDLPFMIEKAKEIILSQHQPNAFNIGMNCGADAGQTVFHFHCHLIPRYKGDMHNPRGGVRHVIAGKGDY
ncbi:HIT family protein [Chryseobacterium vrystaatense]|uniref:Diadenosine tetraphosphate (Ap4A) hydrolase n=1 Tax=Chryseobacterium vrystaatense TaxID=307480 RepID=A0A1M5IIJ8_9FLAO|nr:HIT family protein [Chryseobacterium vrystaatense]SHG27730.1 Diadenosine tetraphosphate (Ap4A) hydrolase [Chryseobacterium vrystaatense]